MKAECAEVGRLGSSQCQEQLLEPRSMTRRAGRQPALHQEGEAQSPGVSSVQKAEEQQRGADVLIKWGKQRQKQEAAGDRRKGQRMKRREAGMLYKQPQRK